MQKPFELFRISVAAGAAIGLAGFAYLAVGGLAGAVLFAFGLLVLRERLSVDRKVFFGQKENGCRQGRQERRYPFYRR